jgi:hypothetical protein
MNKYFHYLWYVLRHKYYVLIECWRYGLYWRGIKHDFSKLWPSELIPYAHFFNGQILKRRSDSGYYKPTDTGDANFDHAWFLHQKRNDHHWQWWVFPDDVEGVKIKPMSKEARLEMWCDWRGAGRAQGTPDTAKWWLLNNKKLQIHPETREWVDGMVAELKGRQSKK